jgi:hypothetical protein
MADDLKKRGKPERSRISTREGWEREYWKNYLGVSGHQLAAAVRKVGPMVKDVDKYLKEKGLA